MSQSPDQITDSASNSGLHRYRDGWSALSHLIGQGKSFSGNERNCFFLNTSDGKFAQAATAFGVDLDDDGRAVATTDWNFDGAPDIWVSNRTAPRVKLLLNKTNESKWLRLHLEGTKSNRDAIGARVALYGVNPSTKLIRTVRAGDGFLAQSSKWLHFGLGDGEVDRIEVLWPNGKRQTLTDIHPNAHYKVKEGDRSAKVWQPPTFSLEPSSLNLSSDTSTTATRTWLMGRVPLIHSEYQTKDGIASTDQFLGKPLLVTLWSNTCQPCLKELAEWSKEQQQFHDFECQLLALSVDQLAELRNASPPTDGKDAVLSRIGWPFQSGGATTEFVDGLEILQRTFVEWQQPLPVPSSFLLDEHGMLAAVYRGAQDMNVIRSDLSNLSAPPEQQRDAAVPFPGKWASRVFPSDPTAVTRMLEITNQTGRIAGFLERYVRLNPAPADRSGIVNACALWVTRLIEEKRFADLEVPLRKLRELAPSASLVHRQVATQLLQAGRGRDASPHFDIAMVSDSTDAVLHHNAGLAAINSRDFRRAIELLRRSASLDPNDAATHYHLGNAQQFLNETQAAIESFATAHQLKPDWSLPANNLAWLLSTSASESLRDGDRAIQTIEPFCKDWQSASSPAHFALLGTYVAALAEAGNFELALQVNSKLLNSAKDEATRTRLRERQNRLRQGLPPIAK